MRHPQPSSLEGCGLSQEVPDHHHCLPVGFYSSLPRAGLSFPFCTVGKGLTSSGDLRSGPGHLRPRSWAAMGGPPTINPAPPLPPQLPPSGDTFAAGKVNPLQFKGSAPPWQEITYFAFCSDTLTVLIYCALSLTNIIVILPARIMPMGGTREKEADSCPQSHLDLLTLGPCNWPGLGGPGEQGS